MGTSGSRRMDDSDARSRSEDSSDPDSDLATILQYLIRRYDLRNFFLKDLHFIMIPCS